MPQNTFGEKSTIGSVNRLVPSGYKPLPEPMMTENYTYLSYDAIRAQWVNIFMAALNFQEKEKFNSEWRILTHCLLVKPYNIVKTWSMLTQLLDSFLTAPGHYLNLCWLIISEILHHSFNPSRSAAYMHQWIETALVQIMACCLFGTKPLSKPRLFYCQLDP